MILRWLFIWSFGAVGLIQDRDYKWFFLWTVFILGIVFLFVE